METFSPILGVLGFVVFACGICLFLPFPAIKVHRPKAKYATICGFLMFSIALVLDPGPSSENAKSAPKPVDHPLAAKAVVTHAPGKNAKRDALNFGKEISDTSLLCMVQGGAVLANMQRNDAANVVESAKIAVQYCSAESQQIQQMKVPADLGDKADSQFHGALYRCSQSLDQQANIFQKIGNAVDQGASPSEQAEIHDQLREVISTKKQCSEDIVNAAVSAGVDEKSMIKAMKSN